jgi:hypothetical protein
MPEASGTTFEINNRQDEPSSSRVEMPIEKNGLVHPNPPRRKRDLGAAALLRRPHVSLIEPGKAVSREQVWKSKSFIWRQPASVISRPQ